MATTVTLRAAGLNISPNQLSVEEGSLTEATNVIIRRDNVIEPRRGQALYGDAFGTSSDRAKQLFEYKLKLLRHFQSTLQFDNGSGTFSSFAGSYIEAQTGLRIKSIEANSNFYFTTNEGIKKISAKTSSDFTTAAGFITNAGGAKALDTEVVLNTSPSTGSPWFTVDSTVAYRIVWGIKDNNENLILGAVGERAIIYNEFSKALIRDLLIVLGALDDINQGASLITDGNYVNTLKLDLNATGFDIYTNLKALADKLDNDIYLANGSGVGVPLTITTPAAVGVTVAGTTATITFSAGNPTTFISIGDKVELSGFTMTAGSINGAQTVTNVTATTIEFTTASTGPCTALGDIYSYNYQNITAPSAPLEPATHNELQSLQTYLSNIIIRLQDELSGIIPTLVKTTYIDPLEVTNAYTTNVEFTIPPSITLNHFYQIYRSSVLTATGVDVLSDLTPSDELKLVYESNPTQSELNAGQITIEDITPEAFAGANLYTNPSSGEGILQSNDVPPFAKDITRFKEYTFFANTKTRHRKFLSLLGVSNMIDQYVGGDIPTLTIADDDQFDTYKFVTGVEESTPITCVAKASVPASGYFTLNTGDNRKKYYVWYDTTGADVDPAVVDRTGIRVDISSASIVTATNVAEKTRDVISRYVEDFNVSSSLAVVTITNVDIGFGEDSELGPGMSGAGFSIGVITQGRGERVTQETTEIVTVADVAGSLAGKYFLIYSTYDLDQYYVWFKVSGGGSDPAIVGKTGIQVNILTNDTATAVATAIEAKFISDLSTKFDISRVTDTLTINNVRHGVCTSPADFNTTFTFTQLLEGALEVILSELVSPAQAVDQTVRSLIKTINKNSSGIVNAFLLSSTEDIPGKFLLESKTLNTPPFYCVGDSAILGASFSPDLSPSYAISSISVAAPTVVTTSSPHGLSTGTVIIITNTDSSPIADGQYTITVTGASTFTIPLSVLSIGSQGTFDTTSSAEVSENEEKGNRIYYSKYQQPEAVPIANYFDVGARDKSILRIFPLRDSLFVFKEDGVFRVSSDVAPFVVSAFDTSAKLIAPDSIDLSDNLIYGWFDQGISTVSETGVSIVSRPIDTEILKVASSNYPNFSSITFGIGYESENCYLAFTNSKTTDSYASVCYRFSTTTNTWTKYDFGATCGIINVADTKMYLGESDINKISQERKTFSRTDYSDRQYDATINDGAYNKLNKTVTLSSVSDYEIGDVLVQIQTLTTYEFNTLLKKLDIDTGLPSTNYFSTLEAIGGSNMNSKLNSLLTKLNVDTANANYLTIQALSGATFALLKVKYNTMIAELNNDPAVTSTNYKEIEIDTTQECVIDQVNQFTKKLTLLQNPDLIVGPIIIFKAIKTKIQWTPNLIGDPVSLKHLREATLMTENNAWTKMILSFATDLLPEFESVEFLGDGSGAFGVSNPFGDNFFGGSSNNMPKRTYIPRNKQRCRYIVIRLEHKIAREHFNVFGVTVTGESGLSTRAFR